MREFPSYIINVCYVVLKNTKQKLVTYRLQKSNFYVTGMLPVCNHSNIDFECKKHSRDNIMTNTKILLSAAATAVLALNGCGGGSDSTTPTPTPTTAPSENPKDGSACTTYTVPASTTLAGDYTTCTKLTSDKVWTIDGLVAVKGTTLMIEPGTVLEGNPGTGAATSYMVIDQDAILMAEGTAAAPIIFKGTTGANEGEWGGLTIIGNASNEQVKPYEVNTEFAASDTYVNDEDNSGVLTYVEIHNSGITMAQDKEINGLSLIAVGSGTVINNLTVNKSDDDCVELWGGSVNLTTVTLEGCTDDQFDIDDGYAGTVTGLNINQVDGNAAIEMSGTTSATFKDFTIVQNASAKEGGIFFKKAGIGGHFMNGTMTDNVVDGNGAVHSQDEADIENTSFTGVTLAGTDTVRFSGDSADALEGVFDADSSNTK